MKYLALALPLTLAACGGSGVTPESLVSAAAPVESADNCTSEYFTQIAGVYTGRIVHDNPDDAEQCVWNVDIEIVTDQSALSCDTSSNITSELLSGTATCGDIARGGDFVTAISQFGSVEELRIDAIAFPVDGVITFNADTDASQILPTGNRGRSSIHLVISEDETLTYSQSSDLTGVLVKEAP